MSLKTTGLYAWTRVAKRGCRVCLFWPGPLGPVAGQIFLNLVSSTVKAEYQSRASRHFMVGYVDDSSWSLPTCTAEEDHHLSRNQIGPCTAEDHSVFAAVRRWGCSGIFCTSLQDENVDVCKVAVSCVSETVLATCLLHACNLTLALGVQTTQSQGCRHSFKFLCDWHLRVWWELSHYVYHCSFATWVRGCQAVRLWGDRVAGTTTAWSIHHEHKLSNVFCVGRTCG